jgi:hypothetical protein
MHEASNNAGQGCRDGLPALRVHLRYDSARGNAAQDHKFHRKVVNSLPLQAMSNPSTCRGKAQRGRNDFQASEKGL